jgi:hypothetical protein
MCAASSSVLLLLFPGVFNIRRLLPFAVLRVTSRHVMPLVVAVLVIAVVVPMAASQSTPSAADRYDSAVEADRPAARAARAGVSSDEALLRAGQRSIFAGAQDANVRSLELWARPQPVNRHGTVRRGRLSLGWGSTRVRFRSMLPARRATHVVVEWSDDGIGLFFDGNRVEAVSLGAPTETAQAHRVALLGATPRVDLREVALYRDGLRIGQVRRHYRAGAALFGRQSASVPAAPSGAVAHAAAVPGNTALPTISGTAKDGQTLTSTTGTWSGSPTSYARVWQRCDTAGANCVAISGATAATYLLTSTDVGKKLRVRVTATNASGSSSATSVATTTVTAAAPVNTAVPSITGTAKDGQTLTSTTGAWTGTTPLSYARQWKRCDSAGASCTDIGGATATTYVLAVADVGKTIRVVLTASNTTGNASATSIATATVTTAAPANTALPAISGTAKEGQLLSASNGSWTGSATITYTYQWQTCNASGASCTAISAATLSSYRLASTDVGKTVRATVTATNATGSSSATSAASAAITTGPPVNTTVPTVTGTAKDGQMLTTANGTWAGTATIAYTRQWKRCNSAGASCTNISGATGTTYTLTATDVGKTVKATWTATNSLGSATADTALSAVVNVAAPVNTISPAITGTARDGQTLTSTTGTWTGSATITYTRQWKRCDAGEASCSNISGATGSTYVVGSPDLGSTIRVTVTATNSGGSASADAPATAVVSGSVPANTALPTITGSAKDGQTLTSTNGTWTGSATITYTRQWRQCDGSGSNCVDIQGATQATYLLTGNEAGRRIRVVVTATNGLGSTSATSAATSSVARLAPANTTAPTFASELSGAGTKEGVSQAAVAGTWAGTAPLTYTYQWQRCDATGAGCADLADEDNSRYWPTAGDVGSTLRVNVTARNSAGSATASSAVSGVVDHSKPLPTDSNHVSPHSGGWTPPGNKLPGTPFPFSTMGQSVPYWQGSDPITKTWQWMHCDEHGDNCSDIPGATERDHDLSPYDEPGYTLRVRTTATNPYGSTVDVSLASEVVASPAPLFVAAATITGNTRNHLELSVNPGTWNDLYWDLRWTGYEWRRCSADVTEIEDIDPENCPYITDDDGHHVRGETYVLTDADVGHRIAVMETVETEGGFYSGHISEPSAIVTDASTPPTVTLGGSLVANPNAWLDGDSYDLTISAVAGSDTTGLASVAVMYDGEKIATYDGCTGASCSVAHQLDIDTSDVADGDSALWVVATDTDHTQTTEQRQVGFNRQAPLSAQHVLVDMAPDGTTRLSWQHSNSPDAASYEVLRRISSEDPFTVIATTKDDFYLDQPSGTGSMSAPVARMSAARIGLNENAPVGGEHVEYQVRAVDQAGQTSPTTATVAATATETPAPAPTSLTVQQTNQSAPTQLTWDQAPGAEGYALYRALDADSDTMNNSGGTRGTPERIADVPATVTDYADTPDATGKYTYSVRPIGATGQLGDTTSTDSTALQATKIPPSQEVLDHARDIEAALEDGGAPARERIPCTTKCKALRTAERALDKVGRSADKVVDQLAKLRAKVGSWPKLARIGEVQALLIEEDARLSWEIGTKLRKAYFTEKVPPPTPEIHKRRLVHAGDIAGTWACTPDYWNSACIGNGGTMIIGHLRAPSSGGTVAVGRTSSGGQILVESWNDDCSTTEQGPEPPSTLPGGWQWMTDIGPCPFWWAAKAKHWVPFQRTRLDTPVSGPDGESNSGRRVPTANPGLSEEEAIQRLIDELQQSPEQYAALINWLERQLGNDTASATPDGTPSCTSMTYQACVSAFEHAGFEGPFTKKTLTPDEAWIGESGGAVVDTTPYADDEPDDEEGPVEITVNPEIMPDWTVDDEDVDQHLETNHDNSPKKNDALDVETLRKNVARRCRIRTSRIGFPLSNCWTMPIMITGAADARGPAENDVQALAHNPRWLGLNRRYPTPDQDSPPWYFDQPGPGEGCLRSASGGRPFVDAECDEYPMWAMQQAKGGGLELETPFIRWTKKKENGRQGNVLQHFYGVKLGRRMLFDGCDIPNENIPAGLALQQRIAHPPTFLAVPVPIGLMPSFGICNDGHVTG